MRIFFILAAVFTCCVMNAGDAVKKFSDKVVSGRVSFLYDGAVTDVNGIRTVLSGKVIMQGKTYVLEGNGMKIICDGKEKWTVDEQAKEAVVENVSKDDVLSVPVTVIARLPELFVWENSADSLTYKLTPASEKDSGFSEIILAFSEGGLPVSAGMKFSNGVSAVFGLSSVVYSEPSDLSSMMLSRTSFDSSYIITDLR